MRQTIRQHSLAEKLETLCYAFRIQIFYLFGSRAHEIRTAIGENGEIDSASLSDVDVAVKLPAGEEFSIRQKSELAVELEDILGVNHVDLVVLSEADPFLAANIVRGERLFCRNDRSADEYELYVLRRAGDLAPFERQRIEAALKSRVL
jgi:uncharacterized protein